MSFDQLKTAVRMRSALAASAMLVAVLTIGSGIWQALPSTPGGVVSWTSIALLVVTIVLVVLWYLKNQQVIIGLYAAIMDGNPGNPHGTRIERAIARRIKTIESPRARHVLAKDLRAIAKQAADAQPGDQAQGGTISLFTDSERRALAANATLVGDLANAVEESTVDPRALIMLRRTAAGYPAASPADRDAGARLVENLTHARRLIDGQPSAPGVPVVHPN
jgi:hypothetical protein